MYKGGTYLALGASITADIYSAGTVVAPSTFVGLLGSWIRKNKGNVQVVNKGIAGNTSGDTILDRNFWSNIRADFVTISLGTNDASSSYTSQFDTNMNAIIAQVRSYNPSVRIVVCAPPNISASPQVTNMPAFRTACANIASAANTATSPVTVARLQDSWASVNNATYLDSDGVHPNVAGHNLIFGIIRDVIANDAWLNNLGNV